MKNSVERAIPQFRQKAEASLHAHSEHTRRTTLRNIPHLQILSSLHSVIFQKNHIDHNWVWSYEWKSQSAKTQEWLAQ
ncbi:hypothetical protein [Burkholderia sp. BCC1047]|uniref:hypothetical protein n=1 Tax=Burkholderia sp. BCC1047 TaxID=2676299 RepID=UPI00158D5722|nr:hypothetical protein [Burkholderia sp. BCC1047]